MTTNAVDSGDIARHTAGSTISSGDVIEFGSDGGGSIGIALDDIVDTEVGAVARTGVFELAKNTGAGTGGTQGDPVYVDANGDLDNQRTGNHRAGTWAETALDAAALGRVLLDRGHQGDRIVEAHTAAATLTAAESGSVHTTVGAAATVLFTMPPATVGLEYYFYVGAAQELRIDPDGTEIISLPATGVPQAAGKYLTANLAGESVHIMCVVAGQWAAFGSTGTWTIES